jgi:hypothetical protein
MKHVYRLLAVISLSFLASCGTTTKLQDSGGKAITASRKFSKVVVKDYASSVTGKGAADAQKSGATTFPDLLARSLATVTTFKSVTRNGSVDADTLVISGTITRYWGGSAALRLWVGMGAGSSYFDATTQFRDSKGTLLGEIKTDKRSWVGGGIIASTQTVGSFEDSAAAKIAEEARPLAK